LTDFCDFLRSSSKHFGGDLGDDVISIKISRNLKKEIFTIVAIVRADKLKLLTNPS